jgi:membrane-associated phospholipid phosphatase
VICKLRLICHDFIVKHPRQFDRALAALVAKVPEKYNNSFVIITNVGGFWFASSALLTIFVVAWALGNYELLKTTVIIAALMPLAELAKLITRRKRPETLYAEQMRFKTYSFPSGHSYVSMLTASYLTWLAYAYIDSPLNWVTSTTLLSFAMLVGVSRAYLGAHFPSDVLAGWLLAILMVYAASSLSGITL